ncbi:MAG TPA: DUF3567 domain-containing protein [Caldimonas sp.]|nr:DUF3567 domain-containing protein [Caldimonas sp.]HEX4235567.1 DUF3567 domain-containing protein [Caldimonas sp.]
MYMLYNSDSFAVVRFEIASEEAGDGSAAEASRGGFEIVDKFAQKDIFIEGVMADSFQAGVEALMEDGPSEDDLDEYIARFASLMPQPLVLH